jgi:hypothetical protein
MQKPRFATLLHSLQEVEDLARPLQANQIAGTQISLLLGGAPRPHRLDPCTHELESLDAVAFAHPAPLGSVLVSGPLADELARRTGCPNLGAILLDWGFAEHAIHTIEHAVERGLILLIAPRSPEASLGAPPEPS